VQAQRGAAPTARSISGSVPSVHPPFRQGLKGGALESGRVQAVKSGRLVVERHTTAAAPCIGNAGVRSVYLSLLVTTAEVVPPSPRDEVHFRLCSFCTPSLQTKD